MTKTYPVIATAWPALLSLAPARSMPGGGAIAVRRMAVFIPPITTR